MSKDVKDFTPSPSASFSDEQLVAFLDGELDHAPVAEIGAALAHNPELKIRLDALTINRELIANCFAGLTPEHFDIPYGAANNNAPSKGGFSFMQMAASVVVALGVGFGASQAGLSDLVLSGTENPASKPAVVASKRGWRSYVASYQALYSSNTLATVNLSQNSLESELARVSSSIGKRFELSALTGVDGLIFKRAQILTFKGRPLVQLAFLSDEGEPIALCIIDTKKPDTAGTKAATMEGMKSASWVKGGFDYFLIGGDDETLTSNAAAEFSKSI